MITGLKFISSQTHSKRSQWVQKLLDDSLDKNSADLHDMNLTPHATALLVEAMNSFCTQETGLRQSSWFRRSSI